MQPGPFRGADLQVGCGAEKIFRSGIFVKAADQVGDAIDEFIPARHRGIKQDRASGFLQGAANRIGHALQHLETKKRCNPVGAGKRCRIGKVKEIVGSDPQIDGHDPLRLHPEGHHPLVVGIHLQLVVKGGERPIVEGRLEFFHLQVGAFDDTQLDRRPTPGYPSPGPGGQLLLDGKAVRKIGLEHYPCRTVKKFLLVEGGDEGLVGDSQIPVFLHVEIDEFGGAGAVRPGKEVVFRGPVEDGEPLFENFDGLVKGQRADLGVEGGDFDRDVLDIRIFQIPEIGGQALGRFGFAEHRLAQVVDVDTHALGTSLVEIGSQLQRFTGENDPAAPPPHLLDELGNSQGGQTATRIGEQPDS